MTPPGIEIPIRPDHVERRHALVEMFRPIMLDRVAAFQRGRLMRSTIFGTIAAAALGIAPIAARAATFTFDNDRVTIQGPLTIGDGASLQSFLSAGHTNRRPLRTAVLNSPGGVVREGIAMADAIQAYHVDVLVPDGAECASACFMLFAAGEHKAVGRDVKIGIHSATSTGGHGDDDGNATLLMARYVAQQGVPAAIVGRMVETDSINMTWLSDADLRSMGTISLQESAKLVQQRPADPQSQKPALGPVAIATPPRFSFFSAQPLSKPAVRPAKPWDGF